MFHISYFQIYYMYDMFTIFFKYCKKTCGKPGIRFSYLLIEKNKIENMYDLLIRSII